MKIGKQVKIKEKSVLFHPSVNFRNPIPKKYKIGSNWGKKNPYYKLINGYEVSYSRQSKIDDIEDYYKRRISGLGWEKNDFLNADGPQGHAWAFSNGKDLIIFTFSIKIINSRIKKCIKKPGFEYFLTVFANRKKYLTIPKL